MTIAITRRSISAETAERLLDAGEAAAHAHGKPMILAVVDESGVLKAFRRMDGAPLLSVEIAIDKAFTAVSFGMPSHAWFDFIKDDEPLRLGIVKTNRLVVFGGGYPVTHEGEVIGGVGVSGGHYSEDMKIAEAALAVLAKDGAA